MTQGLDPWLKTIVRTQVTIDSASRVFLKDQQLEVHISGSQRKVQLPNTKFLISIEDLITHGAKQLGGLTPKSLALAGAQGRWAERSKERAQNGLPANVYIANARSIEYAQEKGKPVPPVRYIGRRQNKMTEVYDTVEQVVQAMNEGRWRKEFNRGRYAK